MKVKTINYMLNIVCKNKNYNDIKKSELKYGLEVLYLNVTKIFVIFFLSLLIGSIKECFIFFVLYAILRTFGYGLHAKTSFWCWVLSIPTFVIIPYISRVLIIPTIIKYIVSIIALISLSLYAPADTKKRPLVNKKKRLFLKIGIIVSSICYILSLYFLNNSYISNLLIFALFTEAIASNKYMYKLFKQSFNNYKYYDMSNR